MKLLKIVAKDKIAVYDEKLLEIKLDDDDFYKTVASGKIDLFSHVLTLEEVEQLPFDFRDLNLKNEYRYVELFKSLFELNKGSEIVVKMDYKELEDYEHLNILKELDRYEKHHWVNQMTHLNLDEVTNYFLVDDLDLLKMLVQINIREESFTQFYFTALDVVIRGSFDCSMSIYSNDSESIMNLDSLVRSHDLYIRSFVRGEDT